MTADDVLACYAAVQQLLAEQAALFTADVVDLAAGEAFSVRIDALLAQVPDAGQLQDLDAARRTRLLAAASQVDGALAAARAALERHRLRLQQGQARAERDGAALRHYLPPLDHEPARYLDQRR